jgi:DNA-directed RNA polymerase specialized sigma24 family protein
MSQWTVDQEADRRLADGLTDGDEDALAQLYDRYAGRLYDYAATMSPEPKAAADVVHDALIDAAKRGPRNRLGLRAWLYGAVRRRCLQRARIRGLHWEWEGGAEAPARPVLDGLLARLDFAEQELLLLSVRHGLTGPELGAVTGLPPRRAGSRAGKVLVRAEAATTAEVEAECRRCALGLELDVTDEPVLDSLELILEAEDEGRDPVAEHVVGCGACQSRARLTAVALLAEPPPARLPKTLRHRVMHTGTDPELAGYRADIAARGGALTPDGMPRQPDVPSPTTRKWIFTGGGAAGAVITALVATLIVGPGILSPYVSLPFGGGTQTAPAKSPRPTHHRLPQQAENPGSGVGGGGIAAPPSNDGGTRSPHPKSPSPSAPVTKPPGKLTLAQTQVTLTAFQRSAAIDLSASQAPVSWTATADNTAVQLSAVQGKIAKDGLYVLTVSMQPSLLQLPGEAQITFTTADTGIQPQTVTVTWGLSLF